LRVESGVVPIHQGATLESVAGRSQSVSTFSR
jgi:hypothetical protein